MAPRMIVIAGPPGSGKSTAFPVAGFGIAHFNADDRAATLNGGSYVGIPLGIRKIVNREFEAFVVGCIERGDSFAIETTLRSTVTFEQARIAKACGFVVEMFYLALVDFPMHMRRVKGRAFAGGHSASDSMLRRIYESSLGKLTLAVNEVDELQVYDNSELEAEPRLVMESRDGQIVFLADNPPHWLTEEFGWQA